MRAVVVRGAVAEARGVSNILSAVERPVPCLRLEHNIGTAATFEGDLSGVAEVASLVDRARTAELLSLLQLGEAIWEGKNFHFLLPSGLHARAFVRPAHAIRTLRDAQVIALWLLAHVDSSGTAVVVDTHTLTAVLLALQAEAGRRNANVGPVRVLDGYPATQVDTTSAIGAATEGASHVLGLISVNASGTVRDRIARAADLPSVARADIVSLVDLQAETKGTGSGVVHIASLVRLWNPRLPKRFESHDGACALCERAQTALLVPVDVDTFDVRFPSFVEREMPSLSDPRLNRSLWEACHRTSALRFEAEADAPVRVWRPTEKMTWKVHWDSLLSDSTFQQRTRARVTEAIRELADEQLEKGLTPARWGEFDLVLVPERDAARPGFDAFWGAIGAGLGDAPRRYPDRDDWGAELLERVQSAKRILVLSLGTVTGTTLQRALNEVQRSRNDVDYEVHGLVIHARPARRRSWEVLRNSYAHKLAAAYLSHLPDDWSPLREEFARLRVDDPPLSHEAQEFLAHRQAVCRGEGGVAGYGFLWGAKAKEHISPHSIFGEVLSAEVTFVAVGSAVHTRREAARLPPYRILFEMPAISRSYYDPVIFSCMVRWLRPQEMWWGDTKAQEEQVLGEVFTRASESQRPLLVGELLLAAVQGKLPQRGVDVVLSQAKTLSQSSKCTPDSIGMVELGLRLLG